MKMFRKDEGFTLVELMVVVLIIGILVAIAIPVFNSAKASAQKKACFANQRTIEGAVQQYVASVDGATVATLAGVVGSSHVLVTGANKYIKEIPKCAVAAAGYSIDTSGTTTCPATAAEVTASGAAAHGSYK